MVQTGKDIKNTMIVIHQIALGEFLNKNNNWIQYMRKVQYSYQPDKKYRSR